MEERRVQENVRSNFQEEEGRGKCREMSSAFQEDGNKQFSDAGSLCKNVIRRLTTCKVSCPKIPVHSIHQFLACSRFIPFVSVSCGAVFKGGILSMSRDSSTTQITAPHFHQRKQFYGFIPFPNLECVALCLPWLGLSCHSGKHMPYLIECTHTFRLVSQHHQVL